MFDLLYVHGLSNLSELWMHDKVVYSKQNEFVYRSVVMGQTIKIELAAVEES